MLQIAHSIKESNEIEANKKHFYSLFPSWLSKKFDTYLTHSILKVDPLTVLKTSQRLVERDRSLAIKMFSDPLITRQLWTLFLYSPALSRFFLKQPAYYQSIFPVTYQSVEKFQTSLKQDFQSHFSTLSEEASYLSQIRKLKVSYYLKVVISDFEQLDEFKETVQKISLWAEKLVQKIFQLTQLSQHKIAIIAMGKLGGQELNYQSDIDLIFVIADQLFHRQTELIAIEKKIKQFNHYFQTYTEEGLLFKVDSRVRPDGLAGPPYLSISQYHRYYLDRAKEWEIQALIKARWIAGDKALGEEFHILKKKFIFQEKYSTNHMLLQISEMKHKIETHFKETNFENPKLGPGGIRDIEFIVQFLQILHGKLTPSLNDPNTISTLKKLWNYHAISDEEFKCLVKNYIFLRQLEHYLQLYELRPERKIPTSLHRLYPLVNLMQKKQEKDIYFTQLDEFKNYHHKIRKENCELFEQLFKITNQFSHKLEEIYQKLEHQPQKSEIFNTHIQNLESDYFLTFRADQILNHMKMIDSITAEHPTQIQIHIVGKKLTIDLITLHKRNIFSMICGLVSSFRVNILSGASFIYSFIKQDEAVLGQSIKSVQRHSLKNVFRNKTFLNKNILAYPKKMVQSLVVCSMNTQLMNQPNRQFPVQLFKDSLINYCTQLNEANYEEKMEEISIKIIDLIKEEDRENYLKPIQIKLNNSSHPLYTLLEIQSEDSFLFLYHFTQAIATRNFYLVKIAFTTENNIIHNQLFLTNQFKEKIKKPSQLEELKTTILIIKYFSYFLTQAPNPRLALKQFVKIIPEFSKDYQQTFQDLLNHGPWFKNLAKILGTTENFFEDFIRSQSTHIKQYLKEKKEIYQPIDQKFLKEKLYSLLQTTTDLKEKERILNSFKDEMLFHIDTRWFSRHIKKFQLFCKEISLLTDVVLQAAYQLATEKVQKMLDFKHFSNQALLLALGKWGAQEMGYASDVEFIFIYQLKKNELEEKDIVKIKKYYEQIAKQISQIIKSKKNGIFEIDLRLRPYSPHSPWATSLDEFRKYYLESKSVQPFERLSLTRMRIVNDSENAQLSSLKNEVIKIKDQFVYGTQEIDLDNLLHLRERQQKELVPPNRTNIKFSNGGLVDIEYLVQYLTILHGNLPKLRIRNTLKAISQLERQHCFRPEYAHSLKNHYLLLRGIIDSLRIVRGNAKDLLLPPPHSLEMTYLKRRALSFGILGKKDDLLEMITFAMNEIIRIKNNYLQSR